MSNTNMCIVFLWCYLSFVLIEFLTSVLTILCYRRHTLAFVPTRGVIYAFGLGGNGQLGVGSSVNRLTPVVVKGPFSSPGDCSVLQNETYSIVHQIFSGGDHVFVSCTTSVSIHLYSIVTCCRSNKYEWQKTKSNVKYYSSLAHCLSYCRAIFHL